MFLQFRRGKISLDNYSESVIFEFGLKSWRATTDNSIGKGLLVVVTVRCPNCGKEKARIIGRCAICYKEVCQNCGNLEFIREKEVPVHNKCFVENLSLIAPAFKFIKPKTK